ncbi:hypothetical protein [Dyella sp. C9]|uniref:hypothetical protein n=1 Tax=Dyella sp. C9 TaxID=2202154 RepID=UPI0013009188|nr:hypothetical protein [Dyella sp. C9]
MTDTAGVLGLDWQRDIRYPVVYKVTTGWRIAMVALALFFAGAGVVIAFTASQRSLEASGVLLLGTFVLIPLALAVYCVNYALGASLTLERDAIAVCKPFVDRRLTRAQIRGRRVVQARNANYKQVVPIDGSPLMIDATSFGLDDRFQAWFNALPDLDQVAREETLAEVANDPTLGSNPQERLARLQKAQQLGKAIAFAPLLVLMWVMIIPQPYGLAIACAALLPWVAAVLVWLKPGLFKLDGKQGDVRPNVAGLLVTPPLALALRALLDVDMVDVGTLFLWGALASLPLWLAVVWAPRTEAVRGRRWVLPMLMLPFMLAYGAGLLAITDMMLDAARPQVIPATVTGKDVSRGKSTTYYVHLARWSAAIDKNRIAVPRAYYEAVEPGDTVCVRLHPGRFGLRWVQLGGCG